MDDERTMAPVGDDPARVDSSGPNDGSADGRRGTVIAVVGSDDDDEVMARAISIASGESRSLVIVDRGGEGMMGNPFYDDLGPDDEYKPDSDQSFDAQIARREGRNELARYIETAESAGIRVGGWFPTTTGLEGLREAVDRFDGSVLVVQRDHAEPTLEDRLHRTSMDDLEGLGIRLVVT